MVCAAEADQFAKKVLKESQRKDEANLGYENIYNNAASVSILYRCCRDLEDVNKSAFPSPEEIRRRLTADEVGVLVSAYLQLQAEVGPIVANMSSEEMDAFLKRLAEDGEAIAPLYFLSPDMKNHLLAYSASLLSSLLTATSSAGLPPEVNEAE